MFDKAFLTPLVITCVVKWWINQVDERVVLFLLLACGREHVGGGQDFILAVGAVLPVGTAVPRHATIPWHVKRVVIRSDQLSCRIVILDVAVAVDVQTVAVTAERCSD